MDGKNHHQLIIIGSGPAGLTAALYASRAHLNPIVIDGAEPGGQLMGTSYVENWPGEKSILGPTLMMNMRDQALANGTYFLSGIVTKVQLKQKPFIITVNNETNLTADALIIATGAYPKKMGCPGELEYWGKGVSTCAICDGNFYSNKPVVIVGGGDTAMENASFLSRLTDKITIIHIRSHLTASTAMQEKVIHDPNISIIYNSTVESIIGNGKAVTAVRIINRVTGDIQELPTDAVFVSVGIAPSTAPFKGELEISDNGFLKIHDETRTSVEGVFAAGDVFDFKYRQAIVAAGAGCKAALDVERYLKKISKT